MNAENMKLWLQRMLTALVGEGHLSHVEANGLAANIREEIDNGINEIARHWDDAETAKRQVTLLTTQNRNLNEDLSKALQRLDNMRKTAEGLQGRLVEQEKTVAELRGQLAEKSAEGEKANELEQRVKELEAGLQHQLDLYATLQGELVEKSAEGAKEAVDSSRLAYKAQAEENARQLHAAISRAEFAERECQRNLVNWQESQRLLRSALDREAVLEEQVDDLRHAMRASRVLCESLNEPGPTPPCVGGYKANALAEGGVE